ncbi:MAG: homocysteine S-methyltransferase family protein [Alphaproteobacteria bacterium]|nr:homocysteine S-methyltransferase family protein [Alphaproteobacteria bacterium]MBU0798142.1 homocysteine S-methyltransferase family protein [Alphaproteobacteria bacterium]MBU0887041.1 homocysteine S-methyltransferase family protein [Alphaproteobacteria bacterium]MBU1814291.1 homocysteine S-methyltransferase family protein [Alphaproteobacteria bacterium]
MHKYRHALPQLSDTLFLTDGGLETTLLFHDGIDLPCFASFPLADEPKGREMLRDYYTRYARMAQQRRVGFILETPTWRANPDWAAKLGYDAGRLAESNRNSVTLMAEIRDTFETPASPMVISGAIGPRGDGYRADSRMSVDEALAYHSPQIDTFAGTAADMVAAFTLNYVEEAIGIALAAQAAQIPAALSFTLETDGRLPTGQSLQEAIDTVDLATGSAPAYYMINCAHPTHFMAELTHGGAWTQRIRGLRANASKRSHAELDEATDLDAGDPVELGQLYRELLGTLNRISVIGGCCGTDHRHVEQIADHCLPARAAA